MLDIDPLRDGPTPLPASTVILLRDGDSGLEVLLVQRHKATAFMGGAYVFPGGKLDPLDASDGVRSHLRSADDDTMLAALGPTETIDATTARALFVAAARETFEESGVLLGTTPRNAAEIAAQRARLNAGTPFSDVLAALEAHLALDRLVPASRWVTPAVERKRFDARFFLCAVSRADSDRASIEEHETVASRWLTPEEAVALHHAATIDLPPPTLRTLELLSPHATAGEALEATRQRPPPLVRPAFHAPDTGWVLALPGDPLHPEPSPVLGGTTRFVCRDGRWFSG
ncbi:MAG: NUDIX hydrolase [Deltaproteobacteria bacterium]|nr:NUDIX hydrolase [Deltaproteobacteria bacterium]